jgi:acyl-coenzyme A thioesterase PaaI-like protein
MIDFMQAFLFGEHPVRKNGNAITVFMDMDVGKEGWVGIPHGGIGMGAILELMPGIGTAAPEPVEVNYPMTCAFRMGGAEARGGDRVSVSAEPKDTGISGRISVEGMNMPYITADIACNEDVNDPKKSIDDYGRSYVPDGFSRIEGRMKHLPHYLNCFVCGVERQLPGLKRRFHLWDSDKGRVVCAFAGFNDEDRETFFRFSRNGFVHPMALMAVLDETMGWGGFFASGHGGVSVRLNYKFLRNIKINEKLVFFGRGEKVMGRIDKRMLFWASGCGVVMADDGSFEKVIESSGQWYAMAALTEQMRDELIPKALTETAFALAGTGI